MGKYILNSRAYVTRDEPLPGRLVGKLNIFKRGDEVELDDEQVDRLKAGEVGSTFVTKAQYDKLNEVSYPEAILPEAHDGALGKAPGDGLELPEPMSSTAPGPEVKAGEKGTRGGK